MKKLPKTSLIFHTTMHNRTFSQSYDIRIYIYKTNKFIGQTQAFTAYTFIQKKHTTKHSYT